MKRRLAVVGGAALLLAASISGPAWGWWAGGHGIISRAAVMSLPDEVPTFFRSGRKMVGHMSFDPDVSKNRGTPHVSAAEHGEHYLDLELMKGRDLPDSRQAFIALCYELGVKPESVGYVPYALAESTERLAVAFAEHRKWPDNLFIQQKCLVYAGFLAHYAQDLCQPLHVTIHFNGKKQEDGKRLFRGILEKVDSLPEVMKMRPDALAASQTIAAPDSLMPAILEQLQTSFALVDPVYAMGEELMAVKRDSAPSDAVATFANERVRESVRFTASLMLYAWNASEGLRFEGWLDRTASDR